MSDTPVPPDLRYSEKAEQFTETVRELRRRSGHTLQELGERSGLSPSTISKIENGQLSPSYETLLRLADGLQVDIAALFTSETSTPMASGRRSISRHGHGTRYSSPQYAYELLCADLSRKQFVPLRTKILARSIKEFPKLPQHDGEEFIHVISGTVELHTEHYAPVRLEPGDSAYFDSTMGHACVSVGQDEAEILWITSRADDRPTQVSERAG
jgi:transcriptional regulator with XRE-family HTH domain